MLDHRLAGAPTYDASDNVLTLTQNDSSYSQTLTYDVVDRLKSASSTAFGTVSSITYDPNIPEWRVPSGRVLCASRTEPRKGVSAIR